MPTLTSDAMLSSEGAVLLVPATIKERPAIVAYRITRISPKDFDDDPYDAQIVFRDDVQEHLGPEPWEMSSGEMADRCK